MKRGGKENRSLFCTLGMHIGDVKICAYPMCKITCNLTKNVEKCFKIWYNYIMDKNENYKRL